MKKLAELITQKIVSGADIDRYAYRMQFIGKKVVFTNGCFDVLHRGHFDYLQAAADLGDILIVGLNSDASVKRLKGENRPLNNQDDRAMALASLVYVDAVIIFDEDTPLELITRVKPNVLTKGGDYTIDTIVGASYVKDLGGEVVVIPFTEGYSTSSILEKIKSL